MTKTIKFEDIVGSENLTKIILMLTESKKEFVISGGSEKNFCVELFEVIETPGLTEHLTREMEIGIQSKYKEE